MVGMECGMHCLLDCFHSEKHFLKPNTNFLLNVFLVQEIQQTSRKMFSCYSGSCLAAQQSDRGPSQNEPIGYDLIDGIANVDLSFTFSEHSEYFQSFELANRNSDLHFRR